MLPMPNLMWPWWLLLLFLLQVPSWDSRLTFPHEWASPEKPSFWASWRMLLLLLSVRLENNNICNTISGPWALDIIPQPSVPDFVGPHNIHRSWPLAMVAEGDGGLTTYAEPRSGRANLTYHPNPYSVQETNKQNPVYGTCHGNTNCHWCLIVCVCFSNKRKNLASQ